MEIEELAEHYNPAIIGWINYFGRFHGAVLYSQVFEYLNTTRFVGARAADTFC